MINKYLGIETSIVVIYYSVYLWSPRLTEFDSEFFGQNDDFQTRSLKHYVLAETLRGKSGCVRVEGGEEVLLSGCVL